MYCYPIQQRFCKIFFEKISLLDNFSLNKKTLRAVNQARSVLKGKTFYFKQLFFFVKKLMFG